MTILNYYQKLLDAGLPVISADNSGAASFSRTLTDAESVTLYSIIDPAGAAARAAKLDAEQNAITEYSNLAAWAKSGTAADAETYINGQIWNGLTQAQANTYIDTTIVNITTANAAQINAQLANIRTVFKQAAGAIIAMRGLFILTAKLLIYIRDLVIRFRSQ